MLPVLRLLTKHCTGNHEPNLSCSTIIHSFGESEAFRQHALVLYVCQPPCPHSSATPSRVLRVGSTALAGIIGWLPSANHLTRIFTAPLLPFYGRFATIDCLPTIPSSHQYNARLLPRVKDIALKHPGSVCLRACCSAWTSAWASRSATRAARASTRADATAKSASVSAAASTAKAASWRVAARVAADAAAWAAASASAERAQAAASAAAAAERRAPAAAASAASARARAAACQTSASLRRCCAASAAASAASHRAPAASAARSAAPHRSRASAAAMHAASAAASEASALAAAAEIWSAAFLKRSWAAVERFSASAHRSRRALHGIRPAFGFGGCCVRVAGIPRCGFRIPLCLLCPVMRCLCQAASILHRSSLQSRNPDEAQSAFGGFLLMNWLPQSSEIENARERPLMDSGLFKPPSELVLLTIDATAGCQLQQGANSTQFGNVMHLTLPTWPRFSQTLLLSTAVFPSLLQLPDAFQLTNGIHVIDALQLTHSFQLASALHLSEFIRQTHTLELTHALQLTHSFKLSESPCLTRLELHSVVQLTEALQQAHALQRTHSCKANTGPARSSASPERGLPSLRESGSFSPSASALSAAWAFQALSLRPSRTCQELYRPRAVPLVPEFFELAAVGASLGVRSSASLSVMVLSATARATFRSIRASRAAWSSAFVPERASCTALTSTSLSVTVCFAKASLLSQIKGHVPFQQSFLSSLQLEFPVQEGFSSFIKPIVLFMESFLCIMAASTSCTASFATWSSPSLPDKVSRTASTSAGTISATATSPVLHSTSASAISTPSSLLFPFASATTLNTSSSRIITFASATRTAASLFSRVSSGPTTSSSLLCVAASAAATSSSLIFVVANVNATSSSLFFCASSVTFACSSLSSIPACATTTSPSLKHTSPAATITSSSLAFTWASATTTSSSLIFTWASATTTSSSRLFTWASATTTSPSLLFTWRSATTTSSSLLFTWASATTTSASLFSTWASATTTSPSLFFTRASATTTSSSQAPSPPSVSLRIASAPFRSPPPAALGAARRRCNTWPPTWSACAWPNAARVPANCSTERESNPAGVGLGGSLSQAGSHGSWRVKFFSNKGRLAVLNGGGMLAEERDIVFVAGMDAKSLSNGMWTSAMAMMCPGRTQTWAPGNKLWRRGEDAIGGLGKSLQAEFVSNVQSLALRGLATAPGDRWRRRGYPSGDPHTEGPETLTLTGPPAPDASCFFPPRLCGTGPYMMEGDLSGTKRLRFVDDWEVLAAALEVVCKWTRHVTCCEIGSRKVQVLDGGVQGPLQTSGLLLRGLLPRERSCLRTPSLLTIALPSHALWTPRE
eukprot:jgi/Botrbrau1/13212/Bobra.9_1s0004.1